MANVKLVFSGTHTSETEENTLQLYATFRDEIFIEINDYGQPPNFICLDKETAIKLHRELKKQISFLNQD